MKKNAFKLLLLMVFAIIGQNASARDWDLPEEPTGIAPEDGAKVMLYNVEAGLCMGNGKISAAWSTSAILVEQNPLTFQLQDNGDGTWSIKTASGEHSGKYLFTPSADSDRPYNFIDMGWEGQGCRKFNVEELSDGSYSLAYIDTDLAPEGTYFGTDGDTWDVICNADPETGFIAWQFMLADAQSIYNARCIFYELLIEAEDYITLDLEPYGDVYDNPDATLEELNKAIQALKVAITEAQMREDGYDPSPENPLDLTSSFLQNPSFDDGVNGWENINGMAHDPNGTPYGSEEDGNYVQSFCEKWASGTPLGKEYGIYQIVNLPAGRWYLSANVIASAQYAGDITVKGVKLYAKQGEKEFAVKCATGNNSPKHYVIDFVAVEGVPTEIGLHIDADTEANWVAVDNFMLEFCGKSEMSAAYLSLKNTADAAESMYPAEFMDDVEANAAVKAAYADAATAAATVLENTEATDDACAAAQAALDEALAALTASAADYKALNNIITKIGSLEEQIYNYEQYESLIEALDELAGKISEGISEQQWTSKELDEVTIEFNTYNSLFDAILYCDDRIEANAEDETLVAMIEKEKNDLVENWNTGKYTTPEQVAAQKDAINTMISGYLNAALKGNEDITSMIVNPNFDEDYSGWNMNGYNNPGYSYSEIEYFQKNFNVSQTLKAMPKGRYTLTVQGYQRHGDDVNAVLYANEFEQPLWNVKDLANDFGYFPGDGTGAYPNDTYNNGVYYPNSMEGARQWFDQIGEDDKPLYTNTLSFLLTAPSTDVTIGVKSEGNSDWCLFDNFTLYYHGNTSEAYAEYLQELIDELENKLAEGFPTKELQDAADAATAQAEKAMKSTSGDACVEAINVLKGVIANVDETLAVTKQLMDKMEFASVRMSDVNSSTRNEYSDYLLGLAFKVTGKEIADVAAAKALMDEVDTKFTECVQHDGLSVASEEKPWNMTAAIANPEYECDFAADFYDGDSYNAYGWDGDVPSCNVYSAEFWRNEWTAGVDVHQTIKGLAPGYYKLRVLGYNRQGYGNEAYGTTPNDWETYALLYADDYKTHLCDVLDYKSEDKLCDPDDSEMNESEVEIDGVTYYYPGNMPSSRIYFEEGYYQNMLVFKVEEGQKEVTIGLSKTTFHTWDSLMFDNWTLEYVGTTEPTEQSTAIASVMGDIKSTTVFGVDGVQKNRLSKGINIIKMVYANGNTKVTKVLVK